MFTGIVEEVGTLVELEWDAESARLTIEAPIVSEDTRIGDSISLNGTCLTIIEREGTRLSFEAVPETLARTSLKIAAVGSGLNLERAMAANGRFGGHIVQGHVDGTGILLEIEARDNAHILTISAAPPLMRYVISKGSITLDGISLTVVDVGPDWFTVWIIPHTFSHTNLRQRKRGDVLNIENDVLARYLDKLMAKTVEPA